MVLPLWHKPFTVNVHFGIFSLFITFRLISEDKRKDKKYKYELIRFNLFQWRESKNQNIASRQHKKALAIGHTQLNCTQQRLKLGS